ncbi:MAG: YceI family protein [Balneola sp.]|jgi:polyisoprenoid-binding protein YceI
MSKLILIMAVFLFLSQSSAAQEIVQRPIDIKRSEVKWKGTKMRGLGKHEGIISIKSGYFETKDGEFYGGKIVFDMNSISVTDIPKREPIPRRRLNNHLKSDDFFGVEKYPEAEFLIVKVLEKEKQNITVEGELSIRDVKDRITVLLEISQDNSEIRSISSKLEFDRFNWNIGYKGSWADRTLVDKEIEITLFLHAKN